LKRTPMAAKAAAVLLGVGMIAAACGSDSKEADTTTTAAAATTTAGPATTKPEGATTTGGPAPTTAAPAAGESPIPTGGPLSKAASGADGGEVVVGADQEFTAYNNSQLDANAAANTIVLTPIQPQFTYYDDKGALWLDETTVDKVEVTSKDPFTVTWTINKDAVWDDGDPLGCDDFQMAWVASKSSAEDYPFKNASANGWEVVSAVTCPDADNVVNVVFTKPYGEWWGLVPTVPAHIVEQKAGLADDFDWNAAGQAGFDMTKLAAAADFWNTGWTADKFDTATWLSAGPYKFESFDSATNDIVLVKNDKYWGTPGKLDKVTVRLTPDPTAAVQALANKEVEMIWPQPDADLVAQLKQLGDQAKYEVFDQFSYEHYDLNFANPLFQDEAVRQAFALCVPREEIIKTLIAPVNEKATPLDNVLYYQFEPPYKATNGDLAKQDIAKAKSTLEAAGWALGSDGVYAKDGKKLEFKISRRDPQPRRQATIELTVNACKDAGMAITEDAIPQADFGARLGAGQYDVILFGWIGSPLKLATKSIFVTGGGQNSGKYTNPEVDKLFDEAEGTTDPSLLPDIYNQISTHILGDVATVPIFTFSGVGAWSPALTGPAPNPSQAGDLWNVQLWTKS
jgi:peptide/nickel transport system substrate-binding protein